VLYGVVGALLVGVLVLGGYIYIKQAAPAAQQVVEVQTPTTTVPPSTTLPPPPTTAPPPTIGAVEGKGAVALRAADVAFKRGDYDRAVSQAQAALHEDSGNATAKKLLGNAVDGQKAVSRFRAADAALARGDYATAMSETDAGRALASWDQRGPNLVERIQDAQVRAAAAAEQQKQQQAQQQKASQLNDLLGKADAALTDSKYDGAISLFESVLALDPQNQRAILGKSAAVQARAVERAAQSGQSAGTRPAASKAFVPSKTQAQSTETAPTGGIPGFEESAGVTAKKGTQAADLPGKINFEFEPATVKPGEKYTVRISLSNEGNAPIQVKEMIIATTFNGRRSPGGVAPQVKEVAPQQKAILKELVDVWREETTTWTMEVTVKTVRGETYKNQVTWR
jgi:tetratricopeptide (TPR) repeat protein